MKELVLFYSYSGAKNTKKAAEKFAQDNNFDICEVIDQKRPNKLAAYTAGIVKVMKNSGRKIQPLMINGNAVNFGDYAVVNVFSPVWASHTTPSINSALKLIPPNTKIKLFMVSMSGKSEKDSQSKRIADLGLEVIGYDDIKDKNI